jgi:hypothetical protein
MANRFWPGLGKAGCLIELYSVCRCLSKLFSGRYGMKIMLILFQGTSDPDHALKRQ